MKFSAVFALVVAVLALLFSAGQASPLPDLKMSIKKIGSVVKTGISKIGEAASTAHNAWKNFKNRNQGYNTVNILQETGISIIDGAASRYGSQYMEELQ